METTVDEIFIRLDRLDQNDKEFLASVISETIGIKIFMTALDLYIDSRKRAYYFEFKNSCNIGAWLKDIKAQQCITDGIGTLYYRSRGKRKKIIAAILRGLDIKGYRKS